MQFLVTAGSGRKVAVEKIDETHFRIDGVVREVQVQSVEPGVYSLLVDGASYEVFVREEKKGAVVELKGHAISLKLADPLKSAQASQEDSLDGEAIIGSPMPGRIVSIKVKLDQEVSAQEGLITVEAMKMENELHAPKKGKVKKILVKVGDAVEAGQDLIIIE